MEDLANMARRSRSVPTVGLTAMENIVRGHFEESPLVDSHMLDGEIDLNILADIVNGHMLESVSPVR